VSLHQAPHLVRQVTCDSEVLTLGAQAMMTGWEPVSSSGSLQCSPQDLRLAPPGLLPSSASQPHLTAPPQTSSNRIEQRSIVLVREGQTTANRVCHVARRSPSAV